MSEPRREDEERYYLDKITFKCNPEKHKINKGTDFEKFKEIIHEFLSPVINKILKEQKIFITFDEVHKGGWIQHMARREQNLPEPPAYLESVSFIFEKAKSESKSLSKETVIWFYENIQEIMTQIVSENIALNNGHKITVIPYWPPKEKGHHVVVHKKEDDNYFPITTSLILPELPPEKIIELAKKTDDFLKEMVMKKRSDFTSSSDSEEDSLDIDDISISESSETSSDTDETISETISEEEDY